MEHFADPIVLSTLVLAFALGFLLRGFGGGRDAEAPPPVNKVNSAKKGRGQAKRIVMQAGISHLSGGDWVAIDEQIYAGRKINAIKLLRAATRVGLKEAKDAVEARALDLRVR